MENNTKEYWKTLDEWADGKNGEFDDEFLRSPHSGAEEQAHDGVARRDFLKLMGASIALSQFACVRRPVQHILPYAKKPVEITPGVANFYASSWNDNGEIHGLLVKTREGRPVKLEGNPLHPSNKGALSARAQAQVLGLYDPDRLKGPNKYNDADANAFRRRQELSWEQVDAEIKTAIKEGGVALLTSSLGSPSTKALIADFTRATGAEHFVWEPLANDDVRSAQAESYGSAVLPRYRFDRARMVVSIDCDFLGTYISPTEFNRRFSLRRKPNAEMGKFVAFESILSLTGANADFRVRIKPSQHLDVVLGLAYEIVVKGGKSAYSGDGTVKALLSKYADVGNKLGLDKGLFERIAHDLWETKGDSLVIAGGLPTRTSNGEALQIAVNFLNSVLGNDGNTVEYQNPFISAEGSYAEINGLLEKMKSGKVKTLIIHRTNPGYALPKDAAFADAAKKVKIIYTGDRRDETGHFASYITPDHHHLENWGDSEAFKGVYGIQQPTIRPLYDTRAFQDSLIVWSGGKIAAQDWYTYLKDNWKKVVYPSQGKGRGFDDFWEDTLRSGVAGALSDSKSSGRSFRVGALQKVKSVEGAGGFELVLYPTVQLGDGSDGNIAWLQELPDPVSKVVWDSYVTVSPKVAKEKGLKEGSIVKLEVSGETLAVPVLVQPGQHDDVLGLAVGYGRGAAGTVGNGVGVNAFYVASFNKGRPVFSGLPAKFENTGKWEMLGNVAGHNSMEGRQIVVETTLDAYIKNPESGIHRHEIITLWKEHEYKKEKWGMSIDLNSCTGCSACVIACQSENNIPVVGKKNILTGREMHWIRIDRYYEGTPENPRTLFQPLTCHHCDNAPCETVCPVAATVHSDDGLNDMAYNRCVGTRYCANNCPYKVRRFNWFNYSKVSEPLSLAFNPDVGVRSRGVMEKCTFCVQRIREKQSVAKDRGTPLKDGELVTACQQTCPTDAITFGDLNDPESRVAKLHKAKNSYGLLEDLNTRPALRYQSKIRNDDYSKRDKHEKGKHV